MSNYAFEPVFSVSIELKEQADNYDCAPANNRHETEVEIFSPSSKRQFLVSTITDPANHDKAAYYDDRFDDPIFDPFLAKTSLPRIIISILGMLLTGFFLKIIIVQEEYANICIINWYYII